jgi:hypothetical protein
MFEDIYYVKNEENEYSKEEYNLKSREEFDRLQIMKLI